MIFSFDKQLAGMTMPKFDLTVDGKVDMAKSKRKELIARNCAEKAKNVQKQNQKTEHMDSEIMEAIAETVARVVTEESVETTVEAENSEMIDASNIQLSESKQAVLDLKQAIIWSEIVGPPRCKGDRRKRAGMYRIN